MSIIPIFIPHAGCPHQCVFCNQKKISGQKTASAQAVRQQIEKYLQWIKPGPNNEAAFYGGSFTGLEPELQDELFAPVDELLQKGVIGSVRCSTRRWMSCCKKALSAVCAAQPVRIISARQGWSF